MKKLFTLEWKKRKSGILYAHSLIDDDITYYIVKRKSSIYSLSIGNKTTNLKTMIKNDYLESCKLQAEKEELLIKQIPKFFTISAIILAMILGGLAVAVLFYI